MFTEKTTPKGQLLNKRGVRSEYRPHGVNVRHASGTVIIVVHVTIHANHSETEKPHGDC